MEGHNKLQMIRHCNLYRIYVYTLYTSVDYITSISPFSLPFCQLGIKKKKSVLELFLENRYKQNKYQVKNEKLGYFYLCTNYYFGVVGQEL